MVYTAGEHFKPVLLYEEAVMFKALYCDRQLRPFAFGCVLACTLGSVCAQAADVSHFFTFVNNTDDRWLLLEADGSKKPGLKVPPKEEKKYSLTIGQKFYYVCAYDKDPSSEKAGSCKKKYDAGDVSAIGRFKSPAKMATGYLEWKRKNKKPGPYYYAIRKSGDKDAKEAPYSCSDGACKYCSRWKQEDNTAKEKQPMTFEFSKSG